MKTTLALAVVFAAVAARLAGSLFLMVMLGVSMPGRTMAEAQDHPWAGDWQVMWRGGSTFMRLEQSGDNVTGYLEPHGGLLSGQIADGVLRMEWSRDEHLFRIVCVLAGDGKTFTGRYAETEFFNGELVETIIEDEQNLASLTTPRESLRALTSSFNRILHDGDAASQQVVTRLLLFEGEETDVRQEVRRRSLLWRLLDMSTFRVFEAPVSSIEAGDAAFRIGPAGSNERYTIRFRADDGIWKVLVESETTLAAAERRFLDDLEFASYDEYLAERSAGPRQTMRQFVQGINEWQQGGAEQALATLDLSFVPNHLHEIEGPILADYLNQVIHRAGYRIWQEIPDDPGQPLPYFHYRHPVGAVVIERKIGDEGEPDRWLFSCRDAERRTTTAGCHGRHANRRWRRNITPFYAVLLAPGMDPCNVSRSGQQNREPRELAMAGTGDGTGPRCRRGTPGGVVRCKHHPPPEVRRWRIESDQLRLASQGPCRGAGAVSRIKPFSGWRTAVSSCSAGSRQWW